MKNSQLTTNTKSSSKYTEDWIPIKAISNGTILLDNKLKVTGVKIRPRNIFILDQQSQDSALIALKNFYNTIDFEFWLITSFVFYLFIIIFKLLVPYIAPIPFYALIITFSLVLSCYDRTVDANYEGSKKPQIYIKLAIALFMLSLLLFFL